MTTSQAMPFLFEIVKGERIPDEKLAYFRARLKNRLHAFVLSQFLKLEEDVQFSKAELARRLGRRPEQITRWLGAPGNWEIDTLSDLLLGMGFEPTLSASSLAHGAIQPTQELWQLPDASLQEGISDIDLLPSKGDAANDPRVPTLTSLRPVVNQSKVAVLA